MVTLSIDDARKDFHTNAAPIMEKYGIVSTNNVVSGWVDGTGTWNPDGSAGAQGPMTKEQVKYWDNKGHETASHSHDHTNTKESIIADVNKLRSWGLKIDGFCSPSSGVSFNNSVAYFRKKEKEEFKDLGLTYCRSGELPSMVETDAIIPYGLPHPYYQYRLTSTKVLSGNSVDLIKSYVQKAIDNKQWCILMLHSILRTGEPGYGADIWYWDAGKFEQLCQWLSTQNVDVVTTREGVNRIRGLI